MSTNNTIDAVRRQNELSGAAEKDVDLATLDGFQLPADVTEEFLARMQKDTSAILGMVDTMTLERLDQDVPQFGVPQLSGSVRAEEGTRTSNSGVESGQVAFDASGQQYYILVEPTRDALKNTHYGPEEFGDYIIDQFVQRWGNDVALIGMRANADNGNLQSIGGAAALDDTFDGWIAIAEGEDTESDRIALEDTAAGEVDTMPQVDNTDADGNNQPIDTDVFNTSIQALDSRYRDPDSTVFLVNPDQVQQYAYDLTKREDPLGSAVIFGESDLTPFDYDVVGVNGWPTNYGMFTDPSNLAFGLFEEMELDQTQDTDEVYENRLHSRNWMEGQFDFQIKELQAGVLVTGLEDPTA